MKSREVTSVQGRLGEVARLFLRLGFIAFGGPAAHVAMMRDEVVRRRRWVTDEQFLDLYGATNLIPGPNSTEMAIHLGYVRAGWPGLIAGGGLFILPAMLIVLALAWAYVEYGATPGATWMLYGVKPVIMAVVAQALWGLARASMKTLPLAAIGMGVLVLYLLGVNEIALLFAAGLLTVVVQNARRLHRPRASYTAFALLAPPSLGALATGIAGYSLATLFLTFLKIGAVLYGSGYVLLAFLRRDFVERLGWLTDQQLLDAVAIGQFTPGPVFTTATFIGYLVGGVTGAIAATVAIFLPGFVFVALTNPLIPKLRRSPWMASLLDGVNVAAVGLMAAVAWQFGRVAVNDAVTAALAIVAVVLLIRFRTNSALLVAGGGAAGIVAHYIR